MSSIPYYLVRLVYGIKLTVIVAVLQSGVLANAGEATLYYYDALNRLSRADYGNGSVITYAYDAAGNRLIGAGVVANDAVAPSIAISGPTTGNTFSTRSPLISLAGTSSDNIGVTLVNWSDDRGGIGVATGTTNWIIAGIALQPGTNVISVTAYDAAGNTGVATLAVTYFVPPVIRITGLTMTSNATVQMTVVGPVGGVLAVQTSTNLVEWDTFGIVTNATGSFQFPFSAAESQRFFRAMVP